MVLQLILTYRELIMIRRLAPPNRWAVVPFAAALLILPLLGASSAHAQETTTKNQIVGGWFGNRKPPETVKARVSAGAGILTDVAIFSWDFAGKNRPVCALTFHSGCVSASSPTPYQSPEFKQSLAAVSGPKTWASHIDLESSRAGELAAVMKNEKKRSAMTTKLTQWAVKSGVTGVDLDWENFGFNDGAKTWKSTRPAFVATIKQLAQKLHDADKLLSVTVPAGGRPFAADGSPRIGSGYTVYAWDEIADSIDRLNLMTYDYSWDKPGPIGPNPWAREVVRSAVAQMGAENAKKVVVGVPLYGKVWPTRDSEGDLVTVGACPKSWESDSTPDVYSVNPAEARGLAAREGATVKFDSDSSEYTFTFADSGRGTYQAKIGKKDKTRTATRSKNCQVSRTVWFSGSKSLIARGRMAADEEIGGVFMWNLASTTAKMLRGYVAASKDFPSIQLEDDPLQPLPFTRFEVHATTDNIPVGAKVRLEVGEGQKWRTLSVAQVNKKHVLHWEAVAPGSVSSNLRASVTGSNGVVSSESKDFWVSRYSRNLQP